jgi:predicted RNA-binding protein with RPS1 domain
MDIKIAGINAQIMAEALEQAKKGRLYILGVMEKTLAEPREEISAFAPRIIQIKINPDKIRDVIGPGGKVIRSLVEETGAKIDVSDDGTISIATASGEAADAAVNRIRGLTAEAEVGQTYLGTVSRIVDFGAFVEIFPGTDGLLHISEIADRRVKDVRDELKEGQQILVKCIGREGNARPKLRVKAKPSNQDPPYIAGPTSRPVFRSTSESWTAFQVPGPKKPGFWTTWTRPRVCSTQGTSECHTVRASAVSTQNHPCVFIPPSRRSYLSSGYPGGSAQANKPDLKCWSLRVISTLPVVEQYELAPL